MKFTADTITDEQINRMRDQSIAYSDEDTEHFCAVALGMRVPPGLTAGQARARCAEIFNARAVAS